MAQRMPRRDSKEIKAALARKTAKAAPEIKKAESFLKKLRAKWEDRIFASVGATPQDDPIKARIMRDVLPILLDNQERFFKSYQLSEVNRADADDPKLQQTIYDLVCKAVVRMSMPRLVSVQPMSMPASFIFFMKYVFENLDAVKESFEYGAKPNSAYSINIESQACSAVTEILKVPWLMSGMSGEAMQDLVAIHDLDAIQCLKDLMVCNLVSMLDRAIMKRLFEGLVAAGKVEELAPSRGDGLCDFRPAMNKLHKACLRQPDFIVGGSSAISSYAGAAIQSEDKSGIFCVGTNGGLKVWCDTMMPDNGAILGRTPTGLLDSGFVWAPFVPVVLMPNESEKDGRVPPRRIATRHALALFDPNRFLVVKCQNK